MSPRWLILADDLTGAADCAIAFAKQGMDSVVAWGQGTGADASVLSAVQNAHWRPGTRLYKKIDSTLRGQPAAELAVQLAALSAATGRRRAPLAVVAPAFPATGRVTLDGKVLVNGQPLEQTPLWARDHTYKCADLPLVFASAGLTSAVIPLEVVRQGADALHARMMDIEAQDLDAVVCDCTELADLGVVAEASLRLDDAVWVGSAGLAVALAHLTAPPVSLVHAVPPRDGGVLLVVGSLAEASRLQARSLADSGLVRHVLVAPEVLFGSAGTPEWLAAQAALSQGLDGGGSVLLEIALASHPDLARGAELASRLALLVEQVAPKLGALAATGGDTACALLARLGIHGIRLIDEVEPGVPLGLTQGRHCFPVVTKAGAFGDAGTLWRCLERLKSL